MTNKRIVTMRAKLTVVFYGVAFAVAALNAILATIGNGQAATAPNAIAWCSAALGWLAAFVLALRHGGDDQ